MELQDMKTTTWINQQVTLWLRDLEREKSKSTCENYLRCATKFLTWIHENSSLRKLKTIKQRHIAEYINLKMKEGTKPATIHLFINAMRHFFKWCKRNKLITDMPTDDITPPRIKEHLPKIPTVAQMAKLVAMPNIDTWEGLRDRAMLELMYSSGLRASEVVDLRYTDTADGNIQVRSGKNSRCRVIPLTKEATKWVKLYLDERGIQEYTDKLFVTRAGRRFQRAGLWKLVHNYAYKAGIRGFSPHSFRHACATHLLEAGADISMVQAVLGHVNITSTQRYAHLSTRSVEHLFGKFHPRNNEPDIDEEDEEQEEEEDGEACDSGEAQDDRSGTAETTTADPVIHSLETGHEPEHTETRSI